MRFGYVTASCVLPLCVVVCGVTTIRQAGRQLALCAHREVSLVRCCGWRAATLRCPALYSVLRRAASTSVLVSDGCCVSFQPAVYSTTQQTIATAVH